MVRKTLALLMLVAAAPAFAQNPAAPRAPVGESGTLQGAAVGESGTLQGAAVGESGTLRGAPYRIDIPANWNRNLVVLFHGYEAEDPRRQRPESWPPQRGTEVFLQRGYAVIQSGYSRRGWAVAEAREDTRRLRAAFEQRFGRPRRSYVAGYSMGGHLALATIEQEANRYDGALAMCAVALSATEMIDMATANLAGAAALFPGIIPDLAAPQSPPIFDAAALGRALGANPAAAGQLAAMVGVNADDLPGTLFLYYALTREMMQRGGGFPGTNAAFRYQGMGDDAAFNARVRRYTASPAARRYVAANATLTGRVSDPVVLLANAYDELVAGRTNALYPRRAAAAGNARRLTVMPPVGQGHCRFTGEDIGNGFDRLVQQAERRGRRRR